MRFGAWNVRSLCRSGPLMRVSNELSKRKLQLDGVQEVIWGGGGTERVGKYTFLYGKWNEKYELCTGFLYVRESYQQLRELGFLLIECRT
jgi:hypothetical protein